MAVMGSVWRGEVSLGRTSWLYFLLGILLLKVPFILWQEFPPGSSLIELLLTVIVLAYGVFISVAIWRSTNKYKGRAVYGALAKFVIVLGILRFLSDLLSAAPITTPL